MDEKSAGVAQRSSPEAVRQYYLRPEILRHMYSVCSGKEIVPVYNVTQYGKRPSSAPFIDDLKYMVQCGATSFHGSVELWKNPVALSNELNKQEVNTLRTGWDFILDIDCDVDFEYARATALMLIDALEMFGIRNYSVKFSGSRGIHIAVSHNSFPATVNYRPISELYPELSRQIVGFLRAFIRKRLSKKFIEINPEAVKLMKDEDSDELNPYNIADVEENWGVRHLFRLPYSFNEKTWLVSRPLRKEEISSFKFEDAVPGNVKGDVSFLDKWEKDEAETLVMETLDWAEGREESQESEKSLKNIEREFVGWVKNQGVPEEKKIAISAKYRGEGFKEYKGEGFGIPSKKIEDKYYPPCIIKILEGVEDGRKREPVS
ncbi:MAG: hypothetical protein U9P44_03280, partial [archaeon]|nr:hypothetical protein [archaeon]